MPWTLRLFQQQAETIFKDVASNATPKYQMLAYAVPGGGKSSLPPLAADALIGPIAEKMIWAAPRLALLRQGEQAFLDEDMVRYLRGDLITDIDILRRKSRKLMEVRPNQLGPAAQFDGYMTSFNAIAADPREHLSFMRKYKSVLVIDEPQFIEAGSPFHNAIQPLIDEAAYLLVMGGSMWRHNRKQIACLDYGLDAKPILAATPTRDYVHYSRAQALADHAIIEARFFQMDGNPAWGKDGDDFDYDTLESIPRDENSDALRTLTDKGMHFAFNMLDEMIADWRIYRQHDPQSKFMVVAPNVRVANLYLDYLKPLVGSGVGIAVSYDSATGDVMIKESMTNIRRFKGEKQPEFVGLVTVGMAYVGLDVPAATHLACLTVIRSQPYLDQMFNRVTRLNRHNGLSWQQQKAHIWTPKDPVMTQIIADIMAEQIEALRDEGTNGGGGGGPGPGDFEPRRGDATGTSGFDGATGDTLTPDDVAVYQAAAFDAGMFGVDPFAMRDLERAFNRHRQAGVPRPGPQPHPAKTPGEELDDAREELKRLINQVAGQQSKINGEDLGEACKRLNYKMKALFGAREKMTLDRLREAIVWVRSGSLT